ncbi:MAG: type III pantothenate kinase, partial [Clostridia bacterium]|nr:type III pantothenate kinase [Clostridia bacterium]
AIVNKNSTWEFIGCSFLPGIDSMKKDLQKNAAMVPEITKPKNIPLIGTNTISAVASGIYRGNAILIDGMIDAYKKELGVKDIEVFATGSQVDSVKSLCSHDIKPIPYLTLKGLTILYTKNLKK